MKQGWSGTAAIAPLLTGKCRSEGKSSEKGRALYSKSSIVNIQAVQNGVLGNVWWERVGTRLVKVRF